jgi:predicted DCC family thiol-disulfide oxidoreductase YuxK
VQWVLKHDRKQRIHFAALQSNQAQSLLQQQTLPDSLVLWHQGRVWVESDAVLHLLRMMGGVWKLPALLRFIPAMLRNPVYRLIARNRYRWFGRHDVCMRMLPEYRGRFWE